ncbi:MAG: hypothetical protein NTZ25_05655 [Candidatus Peregrinibacteria bacterium]|nr:hypothetical protein [Candidatus Peregrinibacteria bacterium]
MIEHDDTKLLRDAFLEAMTDAELAERAIREREELAPIDAKLGQHIGQRVIGLLHEIGVVDKSKSGLPKVSIDITGKVSVAGSMGKIRDVRESFPLEEVKSVLGISSINLDIGQNWFLVEFSLTDYRDARRAQEGIKSPEIRRVAKGVKEGTEGIRG